MWIRSQDKTRLLKLYYVRINGNDIEAIHPDMSCTKIGVYSSQEKALKVLDVIEKIINCGGRMFVLDQYKTDFGMSATYERKLPVFQMPQDDEVLCDDSK